MIEGHDVSRWQPDEFHVAGIDFVIIQVTKGTVVNPRLAAQTAWARKNRLSVGFYHFGLPGSIKTQADLFLSLAPIERGDHLWFDWETPDISSAQKDEWIRYVAEKRPEHRVGLYCNAYFWKTKDATGFRGDGLWIASYAAGEPPIADEWLIHQYSDDGGIDKDRARFESLADMQAWAHGKEVKMSAPWSFEDRLAAYRAAGITKIVIMKNAATHNRDEETGKPFGEVYGVAIHHTAGVGSGQKDVCYNGVAGLPGPLCHDFLAKDGTLYVVGHGRTNHAGTVTPAVKAAIKADKAPVASMRDGTETEDGNDFLFGLEIENKGDGKDPYPAAQYDVAVRWAYAHLNHYNWTKNSAWGHKELTKRKIDPSFPMGQFRTDVDKMLADGPTEEEDVALTAAEITKIATAVKAVIYDEVWSVDQMTPPAGMATESNAKWQPQSLLREGVERADEALQTVKALEAQLVTLNAKVEAVTNLGPVNLDLLAVKVADLLAQRLAS